MISQTITIRFKNGPVWFLSTVSFHPTLTAAIKAMMISTTIPVIITALYDDDSFCLSSYWSYASCESIAVVGIKYEYFHQQMKCVW